MDYEYVALEYEGNPGLGVWPQRAYDPLSESFRANYDNLSMEGWSTFAWVPWCSGKIGEGGVCVRRRELRRPKDEPRMWTEKEILELFGPWCERFYAGSDKELVQSIIEDAQIEADMQTSWNKDLRERNEELQAAIDEVYATSNRQDNRGRSTMTLRAVRRCLRPLATKEETNG